MALKTRRPTGLPGWDIALVAGMRKCGKSWVGAEASASPKIARTFWISYGEPMPDEYGAIQGADFEIIEWDDYGGAYNYAGLCRMIEDVLAEPPRDEQGRPNLLVIDGGGRIWSEEKTTIDRIAVERFEQKVTKGKAKPEDADSISLTPDLWNRANDRWTRMMNLLRRHDGPVIITSLLKEVTVMRNGQPTKDKTWTIDGQKDLPADAGIVIEIPRVAEHYVTGVRSVKFMPTSLGDHRKETRFKDFTMDKLWDELGITADAKSVAYYQSDPDALEADAQRQQQAPAQQHQGQPQQPAQQQQSVQAPAQQPAPVTAQSLIPRIDAAAKVAEQQQSPEALHAMGAWATRHQMARTIVDTPHPDGRMSVTAYIEAWLTRLGLGAPAHQGTSPADTPAPAEAPAAEQADDAQLVVNGGHERELLVDELSGMAFEAFQCEAHEALDGVESEEALDALSLDDLRAKVFAARPKAIKALRDQGSEAQAGAYAQRVTTDPSPARWELLTAVPPVLAGH